MGGVLGGGCGVRCFFVIFVGVSIVGCGFVLLGVFLWGVLCAVGLFVVFLRCWVVVLVSFGGGFVCCGAGFLCSVVLFFCWCGRLGWVVSFFYLFLGFVIVVWWVFCVGVFVFWCWAVCAVVLFCLCVFFFLCCLFFLCCVFFVGFFVAFWCFGIFCGVWVCSFRGVFSGYCVVFAFFYVVRGVFGWGWLSFWFVFFFCWGWVVLFVGGGFGDGCLGCFGCGGWVLVSLLGFACCLCLIWGGLVLGKVVCLFCFVVGCGCCGIGGGCFGIWVGGVCWGFFVFLWFGRRVDVGVGGFVGWGCVFGWVVAFCRWCVVLGLVSVRWAFSCLVLGAGVVLVVWGLLEWGCWWFGGCCGGLWGCGVGVAVLCFGMV